ncbi:unnamed protein product [Echinostoma caproni]|uniref:AGC-kinase C-terminal domain-containing protein n=1 Tax=Echinostoma caproni TaxID=27848 RepID=A0A183B4I7_9TREM|nr:unnamed protein product [Echinostoma caproni]
MGNHTDDASIQKSSTINPRPDNPLTRHPTSCPQSTDNPSLTNRTELTCLLTPSMKSVWNQPGNPFDTNNATAVTDLPPNRYRLTDLVEFPNTELSADQFHAHEHDGNDSNEGAFNTEFAWNMEPLPVYALPARSTALSVVHE